MQSITSRNSLVLLGLFAVAVSMATWAMDIFHVVEPCGFCRVQRSVIGILGIVLLLPFKRHWIVQFVSKVLGAFGIVVSSTQHFNNWNAISKGEFEFVTPLYQNDFLLSGGALFTLIGLILVISRTDDRLKDV